MAKLIKSKFGEQFVIDPLELKGTVFEPLIYSTSIFQGVDKLMHLNYLYQKFLDFLTKSKLKTMSQEQEQTTQAKLLTPVEVAAKSLREALVADSRFHLWFEDLSDLSYAICTVFNVRCNAVSWQIKVVYLDERFSEDIGYELSSVENSEHESIWLKSDRSPNGYELMLDAIVDMSNKAAEPQEPKLSDFFTPIEHAINFGNGYRKRIYDDLNVRRDAIAGTGLDTPQYQAMLNCMEADLLTALATVVQDYIDRMTNEMELERQRKREEMDDQFMGFTKD